MNQMIHWHWYTLVIWSAPFHLTHPIHPLHHNHHHVGWGVPTSIMHTWGRVKNLAQFLRPTVQSVLLCNSPCRLLRGLLFKIARALKLRQLCIEIESSLQIWFVIIWSLHLQIPDDVCIILVTYIILFSTDFCLLSDRSMVERTQASWWETLDKYFYSYSSDKNSLR